MYTTRPGSLQLSDLPGGELLGAVPLIGLGLLALNDHFLKTAWPGWFSGKLSDFAGMMFFPFLLTATYSLSRTCIDLVIKVGSSRYRPGARRLNEVQLTVAVIFSGMSLALVNLSPFFRDVYLVVLERIDLLGIWGRPMRNRLRN